MTIHMIGDKFDKGGVWGVTGHRPNRLGGYDNRTWDATYLYALQCLSGASPDKVYTGMALGWDQAIARACITLGIPFVAAIPFEGQERKWPLQAQRLYGQLLMKAKVVVNVSDTNQYAPIYMQQRNEYIVDHVEKLMALYDGSHHGGTFNCVRYAEGKVRVIHNVWEGWKNFRHQKINPPGPLAI